MTLVLALESKEGLLLVSDSQATYETTGQPVKLPHQKIFAIWKNVAWGGSGHGGILQQVRNHLAATFNNRDYFLMLGLTAFGAVSLMIANLVVDVVYVFLDPRIRYD